MKGYSYTSTPPMGRTAFTEPQCLYKGALYLYLYLTLHFPSHDSSVLRGRSINITFVKQFQSLENVNTCAPDHATDLLCSKGKKRGGDIFHALGVIRKDNKKFKSFVLPIQSDGHMKNCGRHKTSTFSPL